MQTEVDAVFERMSVLVVDDNGFMRTMLKAILRAFGAQKITEASDGADALREVIAAPPDLVITDWNMAPLDGIELARLLRTARDVPDPTIPVIMVSGYSERCLVAQARDAGINQFLVKPVSPAVLQRHVGDIFLQPRPFIETQRYIGPCRRRRDRTFRGKDRRRTVYPQPVHAPEAIPSGGLDQMLPDWRVA